MELNYTITLPGTLDTMQNVYASARTVGHGISTIFLISFNPFPESREGAEKC